MDADRMTGQKWVVTGLSRLSGEREVISSPHSRWKAEALRIGVTLPCLTVLTAACAWQAPLVTAYSLAASAWIVYRLNQEEKGGAA